MGGHRDPKIAPRENGAWVEVGPRIGAVPKGSALFIDQGGYEAGYIRHLSILT